MSSKMNYASGSKERDYFRATSTRQRPTTFVMPASTSTGIFGSTHFDANPRNTNFIFGSFPQPTGAVSFGQPPPNFGMPASTCTGTFGDKFLVQQATKAPRENKVPSDLKELFLQQKECDATIKINEKEFQVHKAILIARSSVFESTFRNNMKEKESSTIEIEDGDPSFFSDFLCFLYSGDAELVSMENVFSLFVAADKYDVQDLKAVCLEFMKENLSVDKFFDIIALALLHSEGELVVAATDFFVKNSLEIVETVKWQTFLTDNPIQGNELFIKALKARTCAKCQI